MSLLNRASTRPLASPHQEATAAATHDHYPEERLRAQGRLQAQRSSPASLGAADFEGMEVCSSQQLVWNSPPDTLPNHKITLTMGNSRISEMSLGNGPVFMVLQKPEILNQTNDSLQRIFACKAVLTCCYPWGSTWMLEQWAYHKLRSQGKFPISSITCLSSISNGLPGQYGGDSIPRWKSTCICSKYACTTRVLAKDS